MDSRIRELKKEKLIGALIPKFAIPKLFMTFNPKSKIVFRLLYLIIFVIFQSYGIE
jgi:hypothetical protein